MRKVLIGVLGLMAVGTGLSCGGGSNVTYIRLVTGVASTPTGTNCSNQNTGTATSITNEGSLLDASIYDTPDPANPYLLDLGNPAGGGASPLLKGTLTNGTYNFTGKIIDDSKSPNQEVLSEQDFTVQMTVNGSGVSGTYTSESKVTCESGCGNFSNSDCTSSAKFQGSVIPGVENLSGVGPAATTSASGL